MEDVVPGLQITRGVEEWKRLEQASRMTLELVDGDEQGGEMMAWILPLM